ncbi:MAG: amidohydrolase family protein [Rhodospirillaceae bacterium]|nr:amidohydrolase family protein [Rhodospirillaceae bacterium]
MDGPIKPMTAKSFPVIALCSFLSLVFTGTANAAEKIPIIDAHSQVDHLTDLDSIVPLLDKAGVRRVILAARGKLKHFDMGALANKYPDRITIAMRTKGRAYAANKPRYYKLLRKQTEMDQFRGMAEVILWHAEKGDKAPEWSVPVKSPQVQAALKIALERKWPFIPHYEFGSAGFFSRGGFMKELEGLLQDYPNHPFLLIHMAQLDAKEAKRLIEAHGNVHFLTSHANTYSVSRSNQPWVNMFDGEKLSAEWRALIIAHPDRFVMAFDNVFSEHWGTYFLEQVALWRKALADLPVKVAHMIAHGNAERLWRLPR